MILLPKLTSPAFLIRFALEGKGGGKGISLLCCSCGKSGPLRWFCLPVRPMPVLLVLVSL